jgi:hypothetical protein
MPKRNAPKSEWTDPAAPTELLGDLNARDGDLFLSMKDSIDELGTLGIAVTRSVDCRTFEFHGENRELTAIARAAYRLGHETLEAVVVRGEVEQLLSKLAGAFQSANVRQRDKARRDAAFLQLYAARLANGPVCIKSLSADCGIKRSTGYGIVSRFNESIDQQAHELRRVHSLSRREIVDALLKSNDGRPGVTRDTIEKAIGEVRKNK